MCALRFRTDPVSSELSKNYPLDFQPYGRLVYKRSEGGWIGYLEGIVSANRVEICIEADLDEESLSCKLELLREFVTKLNPLMDKLFSHIHQSYLSSEWEKSIEELREMYFLTAISLKRDGETYWVVLEPEFSVDSIFNYFIRFTIVGDSITWSNISKGKI